MKFTDQDVREIRQKAVGFQMQGKTGYAELAEFYGTTRDYISKVISGKKRRNVELQ